MCINAAYDAVLLLNLRELIKHRVMGLSFVRLGSISAQH